MKRLTFGDYTVNFLETGHISLLSNRDLGAIIAGQRTFVLL